MHIASTRPAKLTFRPRLGSESAALATWTNVREETEQRTEVDNVAHVAEESVHLRQPSVSAADCRLC